MIDLSKHKLKLDYPCSWIYKVVVLESSNIKVIIKDILIEREYKIKKSKVSTKGKFESYSVDMIVHNEDDRKAICELLGNHDEIKMVL